MILPPLTSDATVYAKWTANACTVKYDAGGGQGSMPDQKFTFGVPENLTRNTLHPQRVGVHRLEARRHRRRISGMASGSPT